MPRADAFFLPFRQGRRFCLLHPAAPAATGRAPILYVHPFAEEMNKSRRMAAVQARAFAAAGWTVLQVDLFGCGDSDGDFGAADWAGWVNDVVEAATWLRAQYGAAPLLWGLRTGCLLAAEAAGAIGTSTDLLFWQPVVSGKQYLRQFLRVKLAGQLVAEGGQDRTSTEQLHARLRQGESLEVAGYEISSALASGLDAADLLPPPSAGRVAWLDVAGEESTELAPASQKRVDAWRSQGVRITGRAVGGPSFWQTQEITECPALIDATTSVVGEWRP